MIEGTPIARGWNDACDDEGLCSPGIARLLARCWARRGTASAAEPLDDRLGVRTPLVFLLIRSDIQKDLGLEPAQIAEVKSVRGRALRQGTQLEGQERPRSGRGTPGDR